MAQIQQRILTTVALAASVAGSGQAGRFYNDDPLETMPPPGRVESPLKRKLDNLYDFMSGTFIDPAEHQRPTAVIPAQGVNTLGEVPDSDWYTNRHGRRRLSIAELVAGPGSENPPAKDGPWRVIACKTEGVTPGLTIVDSRGRRYLLKFDPIDYPELASAADVIGSKFFHALGYYAPENYIVNFERSQLVADLKSKVIDSRGRERPLHEQDIDSILSPRRKGEKGYRAMASRFIQGQLVGPFRFHGVRTDDPNDVVAHEHRRDLRGLAVFCAWLGHNDAKSLNSLDSVVEQDGLRYIRHYLIDFGGILGSDSFTAKSPRAGNEYMFSWNYAAKQFFSLGLYVPKWMRADYPHITGVGRFESQVFDPAQWKTNYPIAAFENRLPDDEFWAAKQVMAFTDEEIRAMVATGEFSDSRAVDWLTKALCERRDKIGRTYLRKVLPLDRFEIAEGRLRFDDLAVKHGFDAPKTYSYNWSRYDNSTDQASPIDGATSSEVPPMFIKAPAGSYVMVRIAAADSEKTVSVFLRNTRADIKVVGVDRKW